MMDLIVIGGGSAGLAAAKKAAEFGQNVVLCEEDAMGGTCVNYGCVPKKIWHSIAHFKQSLQLAGDHGWHVDDVSFSWSEAAQKCRDYVVRLSRRHHETCVQAGVNILNGRATFLDSSTISIQNQTIRAKKILVAVGSASNHLAIEGTELCDHSTDFFHWDTLPDSVVVVGGGYIAIELASILNALGVDTHLVIRKDYVLSGFDADLRHHLQALLVKRGITMYPNMNVERVETDPNGFVTCLSDGQFLYSTKVLQAIGRSPNTASLGCDVAGIECDDFGAIKVDADYRTSQPSVFAIGDCIDAPRLTPVAIAQARQWAYHQFSRKEFLADFKCIPTAVFALPEAATVGMSQAEAEKAFESVSVSVRRFYPLTSALTDTHKEHVLMKLVFEGEAHRVVGAHIVCEGASEIVQTLAIAIQKGITKSDLDLTMALHPSLAEEMVTLY